MKIYYKELSISNEIQNYSHIKDIELKNNACLIDLLCLLYKDGFEYEAQVFVNSKQIQIENFDIQLKENDLVTISFLPQDVIITMIIINILISVLLSYLFKPKSPENRASQSVYSVQQDQIKAYPNEVIPVQYGRVRQYPKLISPAYKFYMNNKQYHVLHTLLGVGNYDINGIYINDTNINSITEIVKYQITEVGSKLSHISNCKTKFGTNLMAYIVHSPESLASISQQNQGDKTEFISLNPAKTKINKAIINFNFAGGLYWNDEGSINPFNVQMFIKFVEIDDEDNELFYYRTFTHSVTQATNSAYTNTFSTTLKEGRYKVYIERLTNKPSQAACDYTIEAVHGFDIEAPSYLTEDYTFITFFAEVGSSIAANSGLKINVDCKRKADTRKYNTLLDFVKDIWTNEKYGMNEDLIYLDIREELQEEISLIIDKSENAYDHLSSVLKSFGYQIYPYLNKFVISKQATQDYRTLLFNETNSKDISFSYNLKPINEQLKGIKVRYIPTGEINFETIQYPEDALSYDESVLPGVSTYEAAFKAAVFLYNKNKFIKKTAQITTDLEGLIPELHSRVGIATEYLDNTFASKIAIIENNIITLTEPILIKANKQYYAIIETISNINSSIFSLAIENEDIYTKTLYASETIDFITTEESYVIIGDRVSIVEDYTIESIQPSDLNNDLTKPMEVKLICQEYNPTIFQETT